MDMLTHRGLPTPADYPQPESQAAGEKSLKHRKLLGQGTEMKREIKILVILNLIMVVFGLFLVILCVFSHTLSFFGRCMCLLTFRLF